MAVTRRQTLAAAVAGLAAWQTAPAWAVNTDVAALLRAGGVVAAFRHALAPRTFDPPGFALGNCATQRNLSDEEGVARGNGANRPPAR